MELLRDQFDQAFKNVDLGIRVQVAKAAHEEVRTYLGTRPELQALGFRTSLIGSYPRHTAIWPGKDVDIFGKFEGLTVKDATPGQVYEAVLRALYERYGDRVTEQPRSIKISFSPGSGPDARYLRQFEAAAATLYEFSVDVVPAVHWGSRWGIPNRVPPGLELQDDELRVATRQLWESPTLGERWQETDPEELARLTEEANAEHRIGGHGAFCRIARAVKQMRAVHVGDAKPNGLYLELTVLEAFDEGLIDLTCWPQAVGDALEAVAGRLRDAIENPLCDPVLGRVLEPEPSPDDLESASRRFRRLADDAVRARRQSRCAAAATWRRLFGENGQSDDGWVFPLPDGCGEDGRDLSGRPNPLRGSDEARGFG